MFDVQDHEGCCGDPADAPGAEADVTQGFEGGFEQRVAAFADGADGVVVSVELLLGTAHYQGPGKVVEGVRLDRVGVDAPLLVVTGRA